MAMMMMELLRLSFEPLIFIMLKVSSSEHFTLDFVGIVLVKTQRLQSE